jgi:hypothetical protein
MARSELERWKAEHPQAVAHPSEFAPIREALQQVTLRQIMAATGASKPAASGWRSGRHVPALRHWPALGRLIGLELSELADLDQPRGLMMQGPNADKRLMARAALSSPE